MNIKRILFGAATALLVVGVIITLASGGDDTDLLDKKYLEWVRRDIFKKDDCEKAQSKVPRGNFSHEPQEMLEQLNLIHLNAGGQSSPQSRFVAKLIAYSEPASEQVCKEYKVLHFLWLISTCREYPLFERSINFVTHYGGKQFEDCSLIFLEAFSRKQSGEWLSGWNEFFGAGLNIESKFFSDDAKMHDLIKDVDLAKIRLNVKALIEVGANLDAGRGTWIRSSQESLESLFIFLNDQCSLYRNDVFRQVDTINVARALGRVKEDKLNDRFRLIYKYFCFCIQYLKGLTSEQIEANWKDWYENQQSRWYNFMSKFTS